MKKIETTSREEWLATRRKYITATDISKLAASRSSWAGVKDDKLGAESSFTGNIYTRWGGAREPVILEHLSFLYGIEPNDAIYVSDGRSATPDGVSDDAVAEVKTTIRPWADLDELQSVKPQYVDQVQWQLLVCERDRAWFAFEPHTDFVPGPVQHFEIVRDDARIAELIEVEQEFREYWETDQDDSVWDGFMASYAVAEAKLREAQAVVDVLKSELRERVGEDELSAVTPFGKVSYLWPKPMERFDATAFRAAHKDLAKEFTKLSEPKQATLRITTRK